MARDRSWLGAKAGAVWGVAAATMLVGGFYGFFLLGGPCEDVGSGGSDAYCNHGGLEASAFTLLAIVASSVVVPTVAAALGHRRLFWIGVCAPPVLAALELVVAPQLARG
jgi:uncharacterized membrane protein